VVAGAADSYHAYTKGNHIGLKNKGLFIQYILLKFLFSYLSTIPRAWMNRAAIPIGQFWFRIDRRHRTIAYDNMMGVLGNEMSPTAIWELVRANFIQLARMALEIPSLLKLSPKNVSQYVTFSGRENLAEARSRGKGILALTAHLGNWELMALATPFVFQMPMGVVARTLDYAPLDKLLTEIRTRTGNEVINKKKGAELIGQMLEEDRVVGILLDQNTNLAEGVYVPFFGITACTNKALAMFALRYDATVLPAFNIRRADGRYEIIIAPPVTLIKTGNIRKDILLNTERFNAIIEHHIRMAPDNWLWVHRRWFLKKIFACFKNKANQLSLHPLPEDIWISDK
jgi:Kdo2-lipid IVA lauroyltransferase/acyltransferase